MTEPHQEVPLLAVPCSFHPAQRMGHHEDGVEVVVVLLNRLKAGAIRVRVHEGPSGLQKGGIDLPGSQGGRLTGARYDIG
jgi:hypothetical protein